jgi:hypothetical protein
MNLRTWLEQRLAEGPGRLELWQIANATKPQKWVRGWLLSDAEARADSLADEIAALASVPVRNLAGHVLLVFDAEAEEARARAMLHDGRLIASGTGSAERSDRELEYLLFQCEIGSRLQRKLAKLPPKHRRRR